MARGTATYINNYNSVAAYKAMFQPQSAVLNQAMTRTADTGQVNWATVATEPVAFRDYEVFALGGALQATAPIYVRIDYVGGTLSAIWVTVGTTTDGAGNLGGTMVARVSLDPHNIASGTKYVWAGCDGSYLTFLSNVDPAMSGSEVPQAFVIERTRDATGAATGVGYHFWRWAKTSASVCTFYGNTSRTFAAQSQPATSDYTVGVNIPDPYALNSAFTGRSSRAYPVYTYTWPLMRGASKALMFAFPNDFPRLRPLTIDHYGESLTFLPFNDAFTHPMPYKDSSNSMQQKPICPLFRWD